jgi:hypothetical protein
MHPNDTPLLPTRTRVKPLDAQANEYHDGIDVLYVFQNDKRFIGASSAGRLDYEPYIVGRHTRIRHDQTGASLGFFKLVGIVNNDGTVEGEVPDESIAHYVFK